MRGSKNACEGSFTREGGGARLELGAVRGIDPTGWIVLHVAL